MLLHMKWLSEDEDDLVVGNYMWKGWGREEG
jgi:hypothetical protein